MKKALFTVIAVILCLLSFLSQSSAANIIGDGKFGDFVGDLSYTCKDANNAYIEITLKNTSPSANGGYLTSFAFNIPAGYVTDVSLESLDNDFSHFRLLGDWDFNDGIKAAPFGYFDIGASITNQFLGGGKPSFGISPGLEETFKFILTGNNLDELTLQNFFDEMSARASRGKGAQFFAARFRGFDDGCSDKTTGSIVPIPGTVLLLASGLIGLVVIGKRRRKKLSA